MKLIIDIDDNEYTEIKMSAVIFRNKDMIVPHLFEVIESGIPQKTGEWLRMSDLSEQEDDRYKCSYCGNVVHYKDKMSLYTFNSWCGRCGSNNGRQRGE